MLIKAKPVNLSSPVEFLKYVFKRLKELNVLLGVQVVTGRVANIFNKTCTLGFKFLLENDIIRPSKSSWASPLYLVSKKDGSLRPCGDYRRLNAQTIPDRYPIPRIEDFHHILKQTKIFSKIDLLRLTFRFQLLKKTNKETAIITPFGLYEFNVMSFGLRNAPSTFQRFINEVFFRLDFFFAYLYDILVTSSTEDEHSEHLKVVFSRLEQYGLCINLGKSVMGVNQLEFLGYMITPIGSKPLPEKVNVILNYRLPETINELRTFLGLINFYRRYIKDAAKNQTVLHEYLKFTKKKDKSKILWTKEAKEKFEQCKKDLANAALLSFPNPDSPLALFTDASDYSVGYLLQQFEEDCWKTLAFFSKKLTNAQKGYSTYDRELLGIYLSIKQFKHILEGRQFTIYTDHKSLMFAFQQKNEKASPRQLRHLQYISEFSTNIRHIGGKENIVTDSLSRIESISEIDYDKIAEHKSIIKILTSYARNHLYILSNILWTLNKINRHTCAQIATYKEVDDRFSVIHIDIIGPFPTSEGKTYFLTCIDRFTCWIEVIPLANVMAETVAREFYDHWISRFVTPYHVITDQGLAYLYTCVLRIDRVRKLLEPLYDGPFPVVKRHDQYFAVTIKGKDINISVDRLKPAYLLLTEVNAPHHKKLDTTPTFPNENLPAHQETNKQQSDLLDKDVQKKTTRSGRRVRFPARYKD
ncbi:Transposon Ty3-I Gag-Pol polyprotein [Araneus ventricosus]|uniref:RNA-directed DNA polymerase n=1 Tax=Araneus ventricosus TaxID=182803 RepID=A0A4Y2BDQ5_ARAVE|nr:Transposon Ty3-I Gag-Pol polyprotein [Araneus ventricosus]